MLNALYLSSHEVDKKFLDLRKHILAFFDFENLMHYINIWDDLFSY